MVSSASISPHNASSDCQMHPHQGRGAASTSRQDQSW